MHPQYRSSFATFTGTTLLSILVVLCDPIVNRCQAQGGDFFSGPQVGEAMSSFRVRTVFEPNTVNEVDPIEVAKEKPLLLIFIHDFNRQTISMTRTLSQYSQSRQKDGLTTFVILLDDDPGRAEQTLNRSRHAFTPGVPTAVSLDGLEGPGSYGLNRKSGLTILLGTPNKVHSNFALIQPSLQVDLPKVVQSIVGLIGGEAPTLKDLLGEAGARMATEKPEAPDMRSLLQPLIKRTATDSEVDEAAKVIQERLEKDEAVKREIARISTTIVNGGKLENYGTKRAQEHLARWAKELAPK